MNIKKILIGTTVAIGACGLAQVSLADPFHDTHYGGVKGDLGLQCTYCHSSIGSNGLFGQPSPDACTPCHSPDGAYDGMYDPETGAYQPSNWSTSSGSESAIYDADGNLRPGKEDWCLGCHDDGHSVVQGVQASNIAGKTLSGTWQSPQGIVDTGLAGVENLIDGDITTGNGAGTLKELIFDLGSETDITHIRLYNSGSRKYRMSVWASNDLNQWTRVQWGRKIMAAKPFWDIFPVQQWFATRLDKFGSFRYIKLVKEVEKEVIAGALREFQYKADLSYGYKISGHKISCDNCHDTSSMHIDGIARTYRAELNNYAEGYRFADIVLNSGEVVPALEIPRVGTNWQNTPRTDNDFALCFSCHNKYDLLGDAYGEGDFLKNSLQTNFRDDEKVDENGNVANAHFRHLQGRGPNGNSPDWDSDWNGIPDSPQSCPACHNVHGSPNPVMTRHGELVSTPGTLDRVPMFNFQYKNQDGDIDPDLMDTAASSGGETQFFRAGPAKIERSHTCKMCHNDKRSYNRTPK